MFPAPANRCRRADPCQRSRWRPAHPAARPAPGRVRAPHPSPRRADRPASATRRCHPVQPSSATGPSRFTHVRQTARCHAPGTNHACPVLQHNDPLCKHRDRTRPGSRHGMPGSVRRAIPDAGSSKVKAGAHDRTGIALSGRCPPALANATPIQTVARPPVCPASRRIRASPFPVRCNPHPLQAGRAHARQAGAGAETALRLALGTPFGKS